jgi:hypothetical protein
MNDPISRVSVLSTGTVRIRPEHVGPSRKNTYVWLATSRRWSHPSGSLSPASNALRHTYPSLTVLAAHDPAGAELLAES